MGESALSSIKSPESMNAKSGTVSILQLIHQNQKQQA